MSLKDDFLNDISTQFGNLVKLKGSQSLYSVNKDSFRLYIRYSKVHNGTSCFFGFREKDLRELEGALSFICLLWDGQVKPLILPFSDFEEIFKNVEPAEDGQYKVRVFLEEYGTELYIARVGRFNVDGYFGFEELLKEIKPTISKVDLEFTHNQVQTLLGGIGSLKDYNIWIPSYDRENLDWSLIQNKFQICLSLPSISKDTQRYLSEIDVIWIDRGSNRIKALYEVEHSTPVYSGLLRFNDIYLLSIPVERFIIVSNEERRTVFAKHVNRPTFTRSRLSEICTFLNYVNVYDWYQRIIKH